MDEKKKNGLRKPQRLKDDLQEPGNALFTG